MASILGLVGGIGAVVWAMRDRFVSVAISREPEAPAFRTPDLTPSSTPVAGADQPITDIAGIGPVYATRLSEIGVNTIAQLSISRPEQVAAAAQVPLSRAVGWIDRARAITADH
ncbi:hypothetical protein BH23ACT5_BH23ACT5_02910 [soil metagenome]